MSLSKVQAPFQTSRGWQALTVVAIAFGFVFHSHPLHGQEILGKIRHIQKTPDGTYAMIEVFTTKLPEFEMASSEPLPKNSVLVAKRQLRQLANSNKIDKFQDIAVGRLRVLAQDGQQILAVSTEDTTVFAKAFFPKHRGIMVGDRVSLEEVEVLPREIMAPKYSLTFEQLFQDPRKDSNSIGLSAGGQQRLKDLIPELKSALQEGLHITIEATTDAMGDERDNLRESMHRAHHIRDFLVEQGLSFERMTSIGLGEAESDLENFANQSQENERRIMIRTHPVLNSHQHTKKSYADRQH